MKDLFGTAMYDFFTQNSPKDLITETSISHKDVMPVSWLFRTYEHMPELEKRALQLCQGKILDIGCGAGSHAMYLEGKGFNVFGVDISASAIKTCKKRGLRNVRQVDVMHISEEKFDTLLLLMNGTGICGKLENLPNFLKQLKNLLNPDGQILIDSCDIAYMYDLDHQKKPNLPKDRYYGQLDFTVHYKGQKEKFTWLYLDFDTLKNAAKEQGFLCEKMVSGLDHDYLARLHLAAHPAARS